MFDALGSITPLADTIYAVPLAQTRVPVFVDAIGCRVTTGGTGSFLNIRMAVYRSRSGLPGELLLDTGVVAAGGTGARVVTFDKPLPWSLKDSPVWLALMHQGGNTTNSGIVGITNAAGIATSVMGLPDYNAISASVANYPAGVLASRSFALGYPADGAELTWTFPTTTQVLPFMGLRRAA
jgi:hypothetical protein